MCFVLVQPVVRLLIFRMLSDDKSEFPASQRNHFIRQHPCTNNNVPEHRIQQQTRQKSTTFVTAKVANTRTQRHKSLINGWKNNIETLSQHFIVNRSCGWWRTQHTPRSLHSTHLTLHLSNYNPSTEQYTIVGSKSQDAHFDTGWNGMKFKSSTNCTQNGYNRQNEIRAIITRLDVGNQWFSFCMFQPFVIHSTCSIVRKYNI